MGVKVMFNVESSVVSLEELKQEIKNEIVEFIKSIEEKQKQAEIKINRVNILKY